MLERRNSARLPVALKVRETNGEYLYSQQTADLGEEGVFILNKICVSDQEPYSKLSFMLPTGEFLRDITARIVRENRRGEPKGCAYEFLNLTEDQRISLKRALIRRAS